MIQTQKKGLSLLKTKRKRLFFDIETSYNLCSTFRIGKVYLDHNTIKKERAVICIAWKWEDSDIVNCISWDKDQNDKSILERFIKIANSASQLVAHNGDKFDIRFLRGRCLFHRIPMFPTYQSIDTLKNSRSKFNLNSNRLDYISKYLGFGGKMDTEKGLWDKVIMLNSRAALKKMVAYCKKDVIELEKVYKEMSIYIEPKYHYGVEFGGSRGSCPECGSNELIRASQRYTATGVKKIQYKCKTCYKVHTQTAPKNEQLLKA